MRQSQQLRWGGVVSTTDAGKRLDLFLVANVPGASRKAVKKALDAGQVFVDGRVERRAGRLLLAGEQLLATVMAEIQEPAVRELPLSILYRDSELLAVDKPCGWPVHRTDAGEVNLLDAVTALIKRTEPDATPILLHRLDASTSGVVLIALNPTANLILARQFADRRVDKYYLALVAGSPPSEFSVDDLLRTGVRGRTVRVASGGKPAQTTFRTLAAMDGMALVLAQPKTGRTHQIRAHLAIEGYPLLGDQLYGGPSAMTTPDGQCLIASRHKLHAAQVILHHPLDHHLCRLQAPVPDDFLPFLTHLGIDPDALTSF